MARTDNGTVNLIGRRQAAPKATPAEQSLRPIAGTIREIKAVEARAATACMKARHEIGKLLIRDFDKIGTAQQLCIVNRLEFWETLAKRVGLHSRVLRHCMQFADEYDEAEVDRMVAQGVTWSHVVQVLTLRTDGEREAFLRRVMEDGLTAAALHEAILEKHGNRREGSGKQRKLPEPPRSLTTGLKRAIDKVSRLNDEHEHALFCDEFDLATEIETGPADGLTEDTSDQVDRLIDQYRILAATTADILRRLEQSRPRIDVVFKKREAEQAADRKSDREPRSILLPETVPARADRTDLPVGQA